MVSENKTDKTEQTLEQISSICHHCGKVLDRQEGIYITDPAFAESANIKAYHCASCLQQNHPKAYFNYLKK